MILAKSIDLQGRSPGLLTSRGASGPIIQFLTEFPLQQSRDNDTCPAYLVELRSVPNVYVSKYQ